MRILILLPIILYLGLVVFNLDNLNQLDSINIYGLADLNIPVLFYVSIFLVLYTVFIILIFDSIGAFNSHKIKKLSKEVFELKSKLYDEREDELVVFLTEQKQRLENFVKDQESILEKVKTENSTNLEKLKIESITNLEKQKADTDRILNKLGFLEEGMLEKIKKTFKSKK